MTEEQQNKSEEIDFEIDFYEKLLDKNPEFLDALAALGDLYTRKGKFEKGLQIDKKLAEVRPEDPIVLYNLACSYSLLGKMDDALRMIKEAVDNGYDDLEHMEKDADLINLRTDVRFQKYFSQLRKKEAELED